MSYESQPLAGYAMPSASSQGRVHPEAGAEEGATSCFQLDRERIVRSRAFRQLVLVGVATANS